MGYFFGSTHNYLHISLKIFTGLKRKINDEELHQRITEIKNRTDGKNLGAKHMKAELTLDNICVSLGRVGKAVSEIDPIGVEERKQGL